MKKNRLLFLTITLLLFGVISYGQTVPVIVCPGDVTVNTDPSACGAVVTYADAIALDAEDGILVTTQTSGPLMSGDEFPVGDTVVTFEATDSDSNTVTCSFTITVIDNESPTITCPADITQTNDAGLCGANVTVPAPTPMDNCPTTLAPVVVGPSTTFLGTSSLLDTPTTVTGLSNSIGGDVTIDAVYDGDWNASFEEFEILGPDGSSIFYDNTSHTFDCSGYSNTFTVAEATWNGWITTFGTDLTFTLVGDPSVNPTTLCTNNFYQLTITLGAGGSLTNDYNGTADASDFYPVGTTTVTYTYTDPSGNSVDCSFDVTVTDDEAPVIACVGQPAPTTDSASDSPALAIPDNDPAGISTTLTVTEDVTITDLNVDLDISHTWVGDVTVTIESPAGTTAVIMDRPGVPATGFGCAGDDIVASLDDEATDPVEDECGGGVPTISGSFIPNNPLSVFDGESTMGDWILTVADNATGDFGTINTWGITYEYLAPGVGLDVFLDANGVATINASDLILGATDNCGSVVASTVGVPPVFETLSSPLIGGNGNFGNMFDVNALNEVTVNSFDVHGDTGVTFDVNVWVKVGTHVGSEDVPGDWTLLDTAVGVVSNGDGALTPLNLALGYVIPAGETHAFFVSPIGGGFNYHNGNAVGDIVASDANIELLEGAAKADDFTGTTFAPRVFEGNIQYSVGVGPSPTIDFDCSNLGENLIDIMVTDTSGNSSICTATANVIDNVDPVITCVGPSIPTETGTASDSPGIAITDNDPTGVSSTLTVTDDVPITDLNVDIDITHTWVGDLIVTIESPAGTTAVIMDRPGVPATGFGCDGDDILATLDDEAASPIEDECGGGIPTISGSFIPNNPLSVFDGESTLGDWIITVSDNATGDTGTLNAWGITYEYDGVPTLAYEVELDENGEAVVDPFDLILDTDEACGIATAAADITEFDCSDIAAGIIQVTVFVSDTSGNLDSCIAEVVVVDRLGPDLTCPPDQTVDPGAGSLFYTVPDYFATGEATAEDNCTDPVTITSQDPVAGTQLPDGTYTITCTAEDEYGNVSTCTFELTVETTLGVDDNALDVAIALYPNPAQSQVALSNSSNILLDKAAIFDVNGKKVMDINLQGMQSEKVIDISSLASGVYMVQISGEQASVVKRLIKE